MQALQETDSLNHNFVLDIPAKARVRVFTTNGIIVEGEVLQNPKLTRLPEWLEIVKCVYVQPDSFGTQKKLQYHKTEMKNLEVIDTLQKPVNRIKPLVMATFVVVSQAQLHRVMDSLQLTDAVGLAFHGIQVCRTGTVGWISLNCRGHLINIDVELMGGNEDKTKVWPILQKRLFENETVIKVVHDVRPIVDYLYHQHAIKLKNVFDTQIAEFYISYHQNPEDFINRRESSTQHLLGLTSLEELFSKHLAYVVAREEIDMYKEFRTNRKYQEKLMLRPFPIDRAAKGIAISVKYLILLKEIFTAKILANYQTCVDKQISTIIDADVLEMINIIGKPELLCNKLVDQMSLSKRA